MKRYLLLLLVGLLMTVTTQAQYYQFSVGFSTVQPNSTPFNTPGAIKSQYIYPTPGGNYFVGSPSGYIDSIFFYVQAGLPISNATFSNFTIKMASTTLTNLTANFETVSTVFSAASHVIPTVNGNAWVGFKLTTPFYYDNTKSFIVEISHGGVVNGFQIRADQITSTKNVWSASQSATTGTTSGFQPLFRYYIKYGCDSVRNLALGPVTDTSAEFTWTTQAQQDSLYEYVVTTDPNPPTLPPGGGNYQQLPVTANNLLIGGLQPDSCYYLHIAKKCKVTSITDTSMKWQTRKFCTLPACQTPKVVITDVLAHTGYASWDPVPGAYEYEYAVSVSPTPPVTGTRTTYTKVYLQGLTNATYYFFHLRAYCSPTPKSPWGTTMLQTIPSSVEDINGDGFGVSAYPNPVKDMVTIRLDGIRNGAANAELVDVTGKVLRTISISQDETIVDMSGLAPGMYIIKYKDEARSRVIKINKQ